MNRKPRIPYEWELEYERNVRRRGNLNRILLITGLLVLIGIAFIR